MSGAPGRFIGGTLASIGAFDCTSARRKSAAEKQRRGRSAQDDNQKKIGR
jgi:hypothetical protein